MTKSRSLKLTEVSGTTLGECIKEGIPAADIGKKRMLHPDTILQMDAVPVAGASAVGMISALREKCGKDAVLHMKHRHMLMERQLEPLGGSRVQQILNLCDIEIIADGQSINPL